MKLRVLVTLLLLTEVALLGSLLSERSCTVTSPPVDTGMIREEVLSFSDHCTHAPPSDLDVLILSAAFEFGVDPRMLATTVYRESGCNALALGSSGEIGLTQIHPKVWSNRLIKEEFIQRSQDLWLPMTNLRVSAYILSRLLERAGGDVFGAFRRYNGSGPKARKYAREQVRALHTLWPEVSGKSTAP